MTTGPVQAWSETGHRLVAQVAWDALPGPVRRQAAELTNLVDGRDFVAASTWLDDLKADGVRLFDRWHYINLPITDGTVEPPKPHDDNLLWAIATARTGLERRQAPPTARALALVALLHLVGDAHQPLHTAARFDRRLPDGDRGGNRVSLPAPWRDLHALWDRMAGLYWLPDRRPGDADIARWARELRRDHPPSAFPRRGELDPTVWATEGHGLASTVAYPGIEPDSEPSASYLERTREVCRRRLALAGYRLAALIESALAAR